MHASTAAPPAPRQRRGPREARQRRRRRPCGERVGMDAARPRPTMAICSRDRGAALAPPPHPVGRRYPAAGALSHAARAFRRVRVRAAGNSNNEPGPNRSKPLYAVGRADNRARSSAAARRGPERRQTAGGVVLHGTIGPPAFGDDPCGRDQRREASAGTASHHGR
jgi:hypothetical protein